MTTLNNLFINKANKIHNKKYGYNKINYINAHTKIKITCLMHGDFTQTPNSHLSGSGCFKCHQQKLFLDNDIFIERANKTHNNTYDYSLVNYIDSQTPIKIICSKHGDFTQTPNSHLSGSGCLLCSREISYETFIERANKKHNNKYDYSKDNYINYQTKIKITCHLHGEFKQICSNHINGYGCPKCRKLKKNKKYQNNFIKKASYTHKNKYSYSLVNYVDSRTPISIVCPKHGEFTQLIYNHLKLGCLKCKKDVLIIKKTNDFIKRVNTIHDNKYIYTKLKYVTNKIKVKIICPKHGDFTQTPDNHLSGKGCPSCRYSNGEKNIEIFLINNRIKYVKQKCFNECKNKRKLPFDFYIEHLNILIEYDGEQHYKPIKYYGGINGYEKRIKNDNIKTNFAKEMNIDLLRISYKDYRDIENILKKAIKT